jgi:MFS family permease
LFVASLIGRAPATALSLVLVLRTKELTGSFAAAGLASGAHAAASAVCSPLLGRLLDRRGQPPILLVAGTLVFATSPSSRAWRPRPRAGGGGALRAPGVRTLAALFVALGLAFGAIEVAVPAAAGHAGTRGAAGLLLGAWGLGSFVGGVLATRASAPVDPVRRLCAFLVALTCGHLLLALPDTLLLLGVVLFLSGAAIAPAFGLAYGLVEQAAAAGTVTEAYTWLSTGLATGIAVGAALAGALAEGAGPDGGFVLAAGGAAGAALIAATLTAATNGKH